MPRGEVTPVTPIAVAPAPIDLQAWDRRVVQARSLITERPVATLVGRRLEAALLVTAVIGAVSATLTGQPAFVVTAAGLGLLVAGHVRWRLMQDRLQQQLLAVEPTAFDDPLIGTVEEVVRVETAWQRQRSDFQKVTFVAGITNVLAVVAHAVSLVWAAL